VASPGLKKSAPDCNIRPETLHQSSRGQSSEPSRDTPKEGIVKATVLSVLRSLHSDESGQDLVEYAFVAVMIALGSVASMNTLAGNMNLVFSAIGSTLMSAISI
jgi:pilus assembly protein Flp/PilA